MPEMQDSPFESMREEMVQTIALHAAAASTETGRDALSDRVMAAIARLPRHEFVPAEVRPFAYMDSPLPIGFEKTISQPFIVALMTDLLELEPSDRVLEVGTGLGYQCAVLASLAGSVYSIEIVEELARGAARRLAEMGYDNVELGSGDGSRGWPEHAPFDKILVAAAPDLIPTALLEQLRPGGRMVIPAGIDGAQQLMLVTRSPEGPLATREILAVRFSALAVDD